MLQHSHRRLALRSPLQGGGGLLGKGEIRGDSVFPNLEEEEKLWSLYYLDDTSLYEIMEARVAEDLEAKSSEGQDALRQAYAHGGVPYSKEKSLQRARRAEKLGAVARNPPRSDEESARCLSLSFWLLRQDKVPRKGLQVLLGQEVHTLQFRRPLFGVFDYIWKDISDGEVLFQLGAKSVEEILMAGCSQLLRVTDLRAKLHEVVTASDASESGGGSVNGSKLTSRGLREMCALEEEEDDVGGAEINLDEPQSVLVFDFFAGIGGLSRALELAGQKVDHLVVIGFLPTSGRTSRMGRS